MPSDTEQARPGTGGGTGSANPGRANPGSANSGSTVQRAARVAPMVTLPPLCSIDAVPMKPDTYFVSSKFGIRGNEFHRGIDLAADYNTPIYAMFGGTVVAAGPAAGFGNWIIVDSRTPDGLVSTVYGHMEDGGLRVGVGDTVAAGQHIAYVGSKGDSTGPHLHLELWSGGRQVGVPVDPQPTLEGARVGDNLIVRSMGEVDNCGWSPGRVADIPAEFVPWILVGGQVCEGVGPEVLAAQLYAENGFRHGPGAPVSSAGARGPAQFMPGTWKAWGRDYDRNGVVDVNSIGDAVVAQAHLMCENFSLASGGVRSGALRGDPLDLALAAYNAGFGAVQRAGGMPSGGEYTTQTQPYVRSIRLRAAAYSGTLPQPAGEVPDLPAVDGGPARKALASAPREPGVARPASPAAVTPR